MCHAEQVEELILTGDYLLHSDLRYRYLLWKGVTSLLKIKKKSTEILNLLLAVILTVGSLTFFKTRCGADMPCHTANTVITIIGAVLVLLTVLGFVCKGKAKTVLAFLTAAVAVVELLIPGVILSLCMMPSMSCRATMKPWTMLLSVGIAFVSVVSGIMSIRKDR